MLGSGIPELSSHEDIVYLVDTLSVEKENDKEDAQFHDLVASTGSQLSTRVNFFIHNIAH